MRPSSYARTSNNLSVLSPSLTITWQPRTNTTGRQQNMPRARCCNAAAHNNQQAHRACVTRPSASYCCGYSICVHRSLRSVVHHLYLSLLLCVTDPRSLWTDMQGSGGYNISTSNVFVFPIFMFFFPEAYPRNLDIK